MANSWREKKEDILKFCKQVDEGGVGSISKEVLTSFFDDATCDDVVASFIDPLTGGVDYTRFVNWLFHANTSEDLEAAAPAETTQRRASLESLKESPADVFGRLTAELTEAVNTAHANQSLGQRQVNDTIGPVSDLLQKIPSQFHGVDWKTDFVVDKLTPLLTDIIGELLHKEPSDVLVHSAVWLAEKAGVPAELADALKQWQKDVSKPVAKTRDESEAEEPVEREIANRQCTSTFLDAEWVGNTNLASLPVVEQAWSKSSSTSAGDALVVSVAVVKSTLADGLGMDVRHIDGHLYIEHIIPGGAVDVANQHSAVRNGDTLQPGDVIFRVNDEEVDDSSGSEHCMLNEIQSSALLVVHAMRVYSLYPASFDGIIRKHCKPSQYMSKYREDIGMNHPVTGA